MEKEGYSFSRDLFEIENARNLTTIELVSTFVPTTHFWRLLSAKNQVILGSRGSGKTALAKMISHNHLEKLTNRLTTKMIHSKSFIGIYIPTKVEWVGALKNKSWQTEEEMEYHFQWRLNVATCLSFLVTLRSCLNTYIEDIGERILREKNIIYEISNDWNISPNITSIKKLTENLESIEFQKQQQIAKKRALGSLPSDENILGISFETDLFVLLRRGIKIASKYLDISEDTAWLLCIDEAEFLLPLHQRILNSHMRSHSGNLFFKITTMPYCHYTLETNTMVPLEVGHDFEYVYIDQDKNLIERPRSSENIPDLVDSIFRKRAEASGPKYANLTLDKLLGSSKLLDEKEWDFTDNSNDMSLFAKYTSEATKTRGYELLATSQKQFKNQIGRKMRGLLMLKDSIEKLRGNTSLDIYSGVNMVISCGDGNPRRLITIFNQLIKSVKWDTINLSNYNWENPIVSPAQQTAILTQLSYRIITRYKSEEKVGPQLFKLIYYLGEYMKNNLHENLLTTEQISSIEIDQSIPENIWELIKRAVGLGLLFHNINSSNPDQMPEREGVFRLAYILSPYFKLLPRKGDHRKLTTIIKFDSQLSFFNTDNYDFKKNY